MTTQHKTAMATKTCSDCMHHVQHYAKCASGMRMILGSWHCRKTKDKKTMRDGADKCSHFEKRDLILENQNQKDYIQNTVNKICEQLDKIVQAIEL